MLELLMSSNDMGLARSIRLSTDYVMRSLMPRPTEQSGK